MALVKFSTTIAKGEPRGIVGPDHGLPGKCEGSRRPCKMPPIHRLADSE